MKASNIMTTGVITFGLSTSVGDIVRSLLANGISAVPVLDEHGALVGMVSEADLIHLDGGDFLKSHGVKAADVMTKPVIVAKPEMRLNELVSLFDKHGIKRVPVVDHGKIVGIVSRANILQALALSRKELAHETIADAA
jgi:CBS domain-containing protein